MIPARAFLDAARVPAALAPRAFGLWSIERQEFPLEMRALRALVGYPSMTSLHRWTAGTIHLPRGECVMEDSVTELRKHLPIWMAARGRVLVTGLGLGCVVRGLLAEPRVDHIDVVEIDEGIIAAVGPEFASEPRVAIHHADALAFPLSGRRWDCAWHDVWSDTDAGEPHLQCVHAKLIKYFFDAVGRQGAWAFPRQVAIRAPIHLLGAPRRARHPRRAA